MYSCSGSKCKKLLASLGGREVAQALDDPALIVALAKFRQPMPQLLHVLKRAHPQELLFQRADEPLHAAIAFRLAHEGRRRLHAQEGDLRLASFDLVWRRANSILENSDSVLILGKDSGIALERLKKIASILEQRGYYTYIIREQPDRLGESLIQKVLRHALSSKFIVVENSEPSGHLYELPHVAKLAECVTIILQEEGTGATWMFEDAFFKHRNLKRFSYRADNLETVLVETTDWAEKFFRDFGEFQAENLPWLKKGTQT